MVKHIYDMLLLHLGQRHQSVTEMSVSNWSDLWVVERFLNLRDDLVEALCVLTLFAVEDKIYSVGELVITSLPVWEVLDHRLVGVKRLNSKIISSLNPLRFIHIHTDHDQLDESFH